MPLLNLLNLQPDYLYNFVNYELSARIGGTLYRQGNLMALWVGCFISKFISCIH